VSREAGADREFAVPEDPYGSAHTQAFGQSAEDFPHTTRRGFEAVESGAVPDAKLRSTGLALKIPNIFLATVAAAADEGVDLFIGDAVVQAIGVGTSISSRRDPLFAASRTFCAGVGNGKNG